jgi:hypothetical protein
MNLLEVIGVVALGVSTLVALLWGLGFIEFGHETRYRDGNP